MRGAMLREAKMTVKVGEGEGEGEEEGEKRESIGKESARVEVKECGQS
jgi:hypothetical protein